MTGTSLRFLAATDFSEHAGYAAHRAALLAAEHGAQLELLHVVAKTPLDALRAIFGATPEGAARLVDDVRHMLSGLAAELAEKNGIAATRRVEIGDVLNVIILECRLAGMLAVGARGTSALHDRILGTTAERLLGKCPRPVLVVKRAPRQAYAHVLVPVDLSASSDSALREALRIAPKAAITAVHAYDVPFEGKLRLAGVADETIQAYRLETAEKAVAAIGELGERLGGERSRFAHAVDRANPARLILEKEEALNADLIVMGRRGRSTAEEWLLGSVTRHILADSRCDVMVVPEPG